MSLQVFSPHSHTHSNDPQSPYPCTPSTMCSSPIPNANNTHESNGSSSSSQSYFRQRHHTANTPQLNHHQRQFSSPLCQLANAFQEHQHQRGASPSAVYDSPARQSTNEEDNDMGEEGGEVTVMHLAHGHARGRRRDDTLSLLDSPEMPMSIRSASMSTLGGGGNTPERASPFSASVRPPSSSDGGDASNTTSGMKSHPSAASIPIILAGLNGMKAFKRDAEHPFHEKESSNDTNASDGSPDVGIAAGAGDDVERDMSAGQEQRGSTGSVFGLGLGILQDPIQLMESRRISNSSTGTRTIHSYHIKEQYNVPMAQETDLMNKAGLLDEDLNAPRQDRADSWTSSLVSTGDDSIASSTSSSSRGGHRRPSTPDISLPSPSTKLLPAHDVYESRSSRHSTNYRLSKEGIVVLEQPRHVEVLPRFPGSKNETRLSIQSKEQEKMELSPSQGSEFSISAYDYSPLIPQEQGWGETAVREVQTLPTARSRVTSCTVTIASDKTRLKQMEAQAPEPPTPMSAKSSKKKKKAIPTAELALDSSKTPAIKKGRRRAVTIANPPESSSTEATMRDLRRQSSPPTLSTSRFTEAYATLSPAATIAANVRKKRLLPASSMNFVDVGVRPSTAFATTSTPSSSRLRLGTPLSARPSTAVNASESNRVISHATLFKPLPALPTPRPTALHTHPETAVAAINTSPMPPGRRSGFLSVQTSPRKTAFSRPGTASPAARSFGLVAPYTNLSPTYRDYRSLKSRESFSSLLESGNKNGVTGGGDAGGRSRSASVASSQPSLGRKVQNFQEVEKMNGPPRYISFAIDQESFREICPIFELVETVHHNTGLNNSSSSSTSTDGSGGNNSTTTSTTTYRYLPIHTDQAYPFHHASLESPPILRRLLLDKYEKYEFLNKQSVLPIKNEGIYAVKGSSNKGDHAWRFEYRVMDRLNLLGKPIPGEKSLIPVAFTCAPEVLDPSNARKRKAMDVVYKTLSSKLEALRVGNLPPDCA